MGDQDRKATPYESTRQLIFASIEKARELDKGREKSLVITKLEEALHWLDAPRDVPMDMPKEATPVALEEPATTADQPETTDKISEANAPATAK